MGIFNYCCALHGKKCEIVADKTGQECTDGTIYAVDSTFKKKFPLTYSGYGYAELIKIVKGKETKIPVYDLGYKDDFECWDVTPCNKKSLFICPTCAKKIKITASDFDELEDRDDKLKSTESILYYSNKLDELLVQRDNINKEIRQTRYQIKKLKNE